MSSSDDDTGSVASLSSQISTATDATISPTHAKEQRRKLIEALKTNSQCRRCVEFLYSLELKQKVKSQSISNHLRACHRAKQSKQILNTKKLATTYPLVKLANSEGPSAVPIADKSLPTKTPTTINIFETLETPNPTITTTNPVVNINNMATSGAPIDLNKETREFVDIPDTDTRNDVGVFTTPLKTVKWTSLIRKSPPETKIANRFKPLECPDEGMEVMEASEVPLNAAADIQAKTISSYRPKNGTNKPPPLVIPGKLTHHQELVNNIKLIVRKNFNLKYAKNSVVVYLEDFTDWTNLRRNFESGNLEFHTYATAEEKTHAFVVRGLHKNVSPDEIKKDLLDDYEISVKEVHLMKTMFQPLYLVVLDSTYTLKKLQSQVKTILNTRVSWENRRNQREVTQCRRCQSWGHVARNCRRRYRCSRCAGEHQITECNEQNVVKCANCSEAHRSFDKNCPVYKYRLSVLPKAKPAFVDAPPPSKPAWTQSSGSKSQQADKNNPPQYSKSNRRQNPDFDRDYPQTLTPKQYPEEQLSEVQPTGTQNKFFALRDKFSELNSLINIDQMIEALDHYISILKNCNTPEEKFLASRNFFTIELQNFKI